MREENGQIIIEPNDCIQVIKGPHQGTLGIVLDIKGMQLTCWGRQPAGPGAAAYTFTVDSVLCMYIGKGRIKPVPKGSPVRTVEQAVAASAQQEAPKTAQEPPQPRPAPKTVPQPQKPREQPVPSPVQPKKEEITPNRGALAKVEMGGVDSDMIDLRPKPKLADDLDPELLKPVVFSGLNSREMHGLPNPPPPVAQPQPQPQPDEQGQPKPKRVNPFRKKAKKVSRRRKVLPGGRKGKQERQSLGVPLEGQADSAPGAPQREAGVEAQAGD